MAALLAFPTVPQMTVRAEETAVQAEESEVQTEETEVQNAESASEDFEYTELEVGTLEITKYTGNAVEVIIPAEIEEKRVTSIGRYAFEHCSSLTIEIPSGVTSIGEGAFSGCDFTRMKIPSGVTSIGNYAFYNCLDLASIEIPKSVTSIGKEAFNNFAGWSSNLVIVCDEDSYAHSYAVENNFFCRSETDCFVWFDGGVISGIDNKLIHSGETISELPEVIQDGYSFRGWFTQKTGGEVVDENTKVTTDMTLYAQWKVIWSKSLRG